MSIVKWAPCTAPFWFFPLSTFLVLSNANALECMCSNRRYKMTIIKWALLNKHYEMSVIKHLCSRPHHSTLGSLKSFMLVEQSKATPATRARQRAWINFLDSEKFPETLSLSLLKSLHRSAQLQVAQLNLKTMLHPMSVGRCSFLFPQTKKTSREPPSTPSFSSTSSPRPHPLPFFLWGRVLYCETPPYVSRPDFQIITDHLEIFILSSQNLELESWTSTLNLTIKNA